MCCLIRKGKFMNKKLVLALALVVSTATAVSAAGNYSYTQNSPAPLYQPANYNGMQQSAKAPLKGSVITVPAGQKFQAEYERAARTHKSDRAVGTRPHRIQAARVCSSGTSGGRSHCGW